MAEQRKIAVVGRKLSFAEAEEEDDRFWAEASAEERLSETCRLTREYYTKLLGNYPDKIERFVTRKRLGEE